MKQTHARTLIHSLTCAHTRTRTPPHCNTLFIYFSLSHTQSTIHVHFVRSNVNDSDSFQRFFGTLGVLLIVGTLAALLIVGTFAAFFDCRHFGGLSDYRHFGGLTDCRHFVSLSLSLSASASVCLSVYLSVCLSLRPSCKHTEILRHISSPATISGVNVSI